MLPAGRIHSRYPAANAAIALTRCIVSYASQDVALADAIVAVLERNGLGCWIAPRDVQPGAQYADGIIRAINSAKVMVLVLSRHAVSSAHVGKEIERASSKQLRTRRPLTRREAEAELAAMKAELGEGAAFQYAEIYAQWGNAPKALDWLETAYRLPDPGIGTLRVDSLLDPLRKEPRFQEIERKLKLPD